MGPKNLESLFPLKNLPFGVPHEVGSLHLFCSIRRAKLKVVDRVKIGLQLAKLWSLKTSVDLFPSKFSPLEYRHEVGSPYFFRCARSTEFNGVGRVKIDLQLANLGCLKFWGICSPSKISPLECPHEVGSLHLFCCARQAVFKGVDRVKINLQLAKLGRLKNLGDLFPLKNLPFRVPPRGGLLIPFLLRTSSGVQRRLPRED